MPSISSQVVIYDQAALAAGTKTSTTHAVSLHPESLSADKTQQVWAYISWDGLGAGDLTVNVYNLPAVTVPASVSAEPVIAATSGLLTAASGVTQVLIEVAGPSLYVETVVNGAGAPNCTVYLLATAVIEIV